MYTMNMIDLAALLINDKKCLDWFFAAKLLQRNTLCNTCGRVMQVVKKERSLDGFVFRCRDRTVNTTHDNERGLRVGSFFENCKVSLRQILVLLYEMSFITLVSVATIKSGVSNKCVINFFKRLREKITNF